MTLSTLLQHNSLSLVIIFILSFSLYKIIPLLNTIKTNTTNISLNTQKFTHQNPTHNSVANQGIDTGGGDFTGRDKK
jgi:hypothetical protein